MISPWHLRVLIVVSECMDVEPDESCMIKGSTYDIRLIIGGADIA